MSVLTCGSLFSGVGGMDLGLTRAGFRHEFFAEIDPWRREVLARHWPGVHVYDDVRAVGEPASRAEADLVCAAANERRREGGAGLPCRLDLLAGGFPCQDLSVAGRRAGLAGERSGLFFEFARVADELRPRWLLVENVPGLLSSANGRDMGIVLSTLADLGYGLAWRVLDARYFGVPQRRRRVFIVGHSGGEPEPAVRALGAGGEGNLEAGRCAWQNAPARVGGGVAFALRREPGGIGQGHNTNFVVSARDRRQGGADDNDAQARHLVASTLQAGKRGHRIDAEAAAGGQLVSFDAEHSNQGAPDDQAVLTRKLRRAIHSEATGVRRLTPTECERLMSWPDGWTLPGSDSRRYAACGDGVVANVAEWIGLGILRESEAAS